MAQCAPTQASMPIRHGGGMLARGACDGQRPLLPQHDGAALILAKDVERILADVDADYGGRSVEVSVRSCSLSSVTAGIACWQARSTAGPSYSDVPSQAHGVLFPISTMTHREVFVPMDRAEEKAGPKDSGEQAL
jgi:hypothetical protein